MGSYKEVAALPNVPSNIDPQLRQVLAAYKRAIEVRLGHVGDPLDRAVTLRELSDAGVVSLRSNTVVNPGDGGGDGGDGETVPIPDAPASVNIFQAWREIFIEIGFPVTNTRYLSNYEIWRVAGNDLAQAAMVGVGFNTLYVDTQNIEANTLYTYWVRFVNTLGEPGPWYNLAGTQITTTDFSTRLLEDLSGKIRESQLYQDLLDEINWISMPETGLRDRVDELFGEVEDLFGRADALDAEIAEQTLIRVSAEEMLASQITTLNANYNGVNAALQTEITTRSTADTALAEQITTLGAQVTTNNNTLTAAIQNEATVRTNAVSALAQQVNLLAADISTLEGMTETEVLALIQQEQTVLVAADEALAADILALESSITSLEGMTETEVRAIVVDETSTLVNDVGALALSVENLGSQITAYDGVTTSQVTALARQEITTMVETEGNALSSALLQLQADNGENSIAISNETLARANAVGDLEAQYTVKIATVNGQNVVAGFGLAATQSGFNGAIHTSAIFRVDTFGITAPNAEMFTLVVEDGVVVMDGANIKQATIQSSAINSLQANKITAGMVSGLTLDGNTLRGGQIAIGTGSRNYTWQNYHFNETVGLWEADATLTTSGAAFLVQTNGNTFVQNLYAENGYFRGDITGATGSFGGSLDAATGTFAGDISAASGIFSGVLSAKIAHNFEAIMMVTRKSSTDGTYSNYRQVDNTDIYLTTDQSDFRAFARVNRVLVPTGQRMLIFGVDFTQVRSIYDQTFDAYYDFEFIIQDSDDFTILAARYMPNVSIWSVTGPQSWYLDLENNRVDVSYLDINPTVLPVRLSTLNIFTGYNNYAGKLVVPLRAGNAFNFTASRRVDCLVNHRLSARYTSGAPASATRRVGSTTIEAVII